MDVVKYIITKGDKCHNYDLVPEDILKKKDYFSISGELTLPHIDDIVTMRGYSENELSVTNLCNTPNFLIDKIKAVAKEFIDLGFCDKKTNVESNLESVMLPVFRREIDVMPDIYIIEYSSPQKDQDMFTSLISQGSKRVQSNIHNMFFKFDENNKGLSHHFQSLAFYHLFAVVPSKEEPKLNLKDEKIEVDGVVSVMPMFAAYRRIRDITISFSDGAIVPDGIGLTIKKVGSLADKLKLADVDNLKFTKRDQEWYNYCVEIAEEGPSF